MKQTVQLKKWLFISLILISANAVLADKPSTHTTTVMILGDSISAAYGMPANLGWANLLQQHFDTAHKNKNFVVVNASISGETTAGALARLPKLLTQHQPNIIIIELGANDGLRGFSITNFRNNLKRLTVLAQTHQAKVLLVGMHIPPNYGLRYTQQFYDSYALIAEQLHVPLVPFLLEDIATRPELMQKDGLHPTVEAQPKILDNLLPHLKKML